MLLRMQSRILLHEMMHVLLAASVHAAAVAEDDPSDHLVLSLNSSSHARRLGSVYNLHVAETPLDFANTTLPSKIS